MPLDVKQCQDILAEELAETLDEDAYWELIAEYRQASKYKAKLTVHEVVKTEPITRK